MARTFGIGIKALLTPAAIAVAAVAWAAPSDSLRPPHQLQELEIYGAKQTPSALSGEAVTAISGAEARRLNIESVKGVSEVTPNFFAPAYGSRMTSSIYVRGLGSRIDQPVVGLSIDNIPILNKDAYDFDIPDIAGMEIIRGPQGVLGGRNTVGGQVNVRTLSPLEADGTRLTLRYGNGNDARGAATHFWRPNPRLGFSLTADCHHSDGFYRNATTAARVGGENSGNFRFKTAWMPQPGLSVSNTAMAGILKQKGYPYTSAQTGQICYGDTCSYARNSFADGLTVAWAGKRVVVTSVSTVQYLDDDMHLDQDFLPDPYFTLRQKRREWAVTQDLFTRGSRGRYSWLGGAWFMYKKSRMDAPVHFGDRGIADLIEFHRNKVNPDYPIRWDSRDFTLGSDFRQSTTAAALYHQSIFRTGGWTFEGGVRLDLEHNTLDSRSHCQTGYTTLHLLPDGQYETYSHTPVDIDDRAALRKTWLEFIPKLSASYSFGGTSVFMTFSKGYKAGGYNTQMFSDVLQQRIMGLMGISANVKLEDVVSYAPERSFNYEIGARGRWAGGKTGWEAVAFFMDCRNQQLTVFPPGNGTGRIMTNAGRTHSYGLELSGHWQIHPDVDVRTAWGYTHASFRRYRDGRNDYRGCRVPYAPENTLFASSRWIVSPLSNRLFTPSLETNVRCAGRIWWNETNTVSQPFYALANISAWLSASRWSLELWCRNFTGTRYRSFYFVSVGNTFFQEGHPRTFGATLRVNL